MTILINRIIALSMTSSVVVCLLIICSLQLISAQVQVNVNQRALPIALHQLIVVDTASDAVIRLKGYDYYDPNLEYKVITAPDTGSLYQLSQVFSSYGYEPKAGTKLMSGKTTITGSNNRVYYKRPSPDVAGINKWDTINYVVHSNIAGGNSYDSYEGTITLVPPSGALVGSDFLLGNDGWKITGNKALVSDAIAEQFSRGSMLNHYIYSTDNKVNVKGAGLPDSSLWFFQAPPKFLGNWGIAYGGFLKFTLGAFSGDFNKLNGNKMNIVELECKSCVGPVGKGITLVFPVSKIMTMTSFSGEPAVFNIPFLEDAGWLKDPQNSLVAWSKPSKCDIIQVLSRLSSLKILGDWTSWYESVALDNVQIYNTKGQLPLCAMSRPDASVCTCP